MKNCPACSYENIDDAKTCQSCGYEFDSGMGWDKTSVSDSRSMRFSKGELIEPIEVSGPVEIRHLSDAVNTLVERLRMLEDTRRRLLANLVHELGRPLGAIRSAIHVLRQGAVEDVQIRDELLIGIEDEVTRMQPLLDDLAQLHGVVLGHVGLSRQPISLSEWLPSMILPWRAAALDKGLDWQADIPVSLPTLNSDLAGQFFWLWRQFIKILAYVTYLRTNGTKLWIDGRY